MLRYGFMAGVLIVASGCASTPKGPADLILGKWTCSATQEGMSVAATTTYDKGGTAGGVAKVSVQAPGSAIELSGDVKSTWAINADGKLEEKVTSMTVTSAKMSGSDLAAPMIAAMVQPMVDEMVVNQTSTSTIAFEGNTMTTTDQDMGVVTTCTR